MSIVSDVLGGIGVLIIMIILMVIVFALEKMQRLLDRYRLQYGFDRAIESKEGGNDSEKLNRSEKRFKRRVFKD